MLPKVKFSMEQADDRTTYFIQSKSLTAALQRAILLTEALGDAHLVELEHNFIMTKSGKVRNQILVVVS